MEVSEIIHKILTFTDPEEVIKFREISKLFLAQANFIIKNGEDMVFLKARERYRKRIQYIIKEFNKLTYDQRVRNVAKIKMEFDTFKLEQYLQIEPNINYIFSIDRANSINCDSDSSDEEERGEYWEATLLIFFSECHNEIINAEDCIRLLIDKMCDVNMQDDDGDTALMLALSEYKSEISKKIIRMLINAGSDTFIVGKDAQTIFSTACQKCKSVDIARMLFDKTILEKKDKNGYTPLLWSSWKSGSTSSNEIVKFLIESGADVNAKDNVKDTPLIVASWHTRSQSSNETVEILIEAGADLNHQNEEGKTALMQASKLSCNASTIETVKILIEAGVDVNLVNEDGNSALIMAIVDIPKKHSNLETIQLLIDAGADVQIKNNEGKTALMLAVENNLYDIIRLLVKAGA